MIKVLNVGRISKTYWYSSAWCRHGYFLNNSILRIFLSLCFPPHYEFSPDFLITYKVACLRNLTKSVWSWVVLFVGVYRESFRKSTWLYVGDSEETKRAASLNNYLSIATLDTNTCDDGKISTASVGYFKCCDSDFEKKCLNLKQALSKYKLFNAR